MIDEKPKKGLSLGRPNVDSNLQIEEEEKGFKSLRQTAKGLYKYESLKY